ncbi:MAG TPA: hypothetical protein VN764_15355 [Polyangiaceae bacterium]|nr:hypothetical protein [Polyangiaceae bacterium]
MQGYGFRFFRAGGVDQVELKTGADLVALKDLKQELWVALSCPVLGLQFDERTLALIDADHDGRVQAPELLNAIAWTNSVLRDIEELSVPDEPLKLSSIDQETDAGKLIHRTARALLKSVGKSSSDTLSPSEVHEALTKFNQEPDNGDGILPETATPDESLKALIKTVLSGVATPSLDRNGQPGVTKDQVDAFFAAAGARRDWNVQANSEERAVLGPKTATDIGAFLAVRSKLEDFFVRVRAVSFDARALTAMKQEETAYLSIGARTIAANAADFETFPLAHIAPNVALPLHQGLNPAWDERVHAFYEKIVRPLVGDKDSLTEQDYDYIVSRLAPQLEFQATKPTSPWDAVDLAQVDTWLEAGAHGQLLELLSQDLAATEEAGALEQVERLVHYKRDLLRLANNFVAFRDFYAPGKTAIFQIGKLYIDQRVLSLVMRVVDPAKHVTLGPLAATYLLYCDAKNDKGEKMAIVAAVTNGDVDHFSVGRNALFYDNAGNDWDAVVTRIVDNPISIRQAFWSPYKKLVRLIEEQVNKRAAEAEAESQANMQKNATEADAISKGKVTAPPPPPKKLDIGVVAALGVAVGGITAALGVFINAFLGLGFWIPLGIVGLLLAISTPAMAVAWLKLRRRNLGPLLDANGWAINVLPRINVPLGRSLTKLAVLPPGAQRNLADPFAEKHTAWWKWLILAVVVGTGLFWYLGKLDTHLPQKYRSVSVLGEAAPANVKAEPPATPAPTATPAPAATTTP